MKSTHTRILRFTCALVIGITIVTVGFGQSGTWKYGFELGWSNSKIQGDLEADRNGEEAETQKFNTGFHLSFYARRHFTDLFGLQFGLAYAQRGTRNDFDGASHYKLGRQATTSRLILGDRVETQDVLNGYLDLPVVAFHKLGGKLELGAGGYVGVLLASKADGEIRMSGDNFNTFFVNTEKKFLKDDFGDMPFGAQEVRINGQTYTEPRRIGAYYEYDADPGDNLYKTLDYGLIGQVGFYFNESLNLKARFTYGLADVTEMNADVSKGATNLGEQIFRDDTDRNLSMQLSLGFLF